MIYRNTVVITSILVLCAGLFSPVYTRSEVLVVDDAGQQLQLEVPAKRVVSLSPHTTEMLYSAGAGDRIVGTVSYSDYPPAAKQIPQIGSYKQFDFEQIAALKPDLIVGWQSGNPASGIQQLRSLGYAVYLTEPRTIDDIAVNVERLARLTGTQQAARQPVQEFRAAIEALEKTYSDAEPVSLFYEVWNSPLMTLNGEHLFSDVARLCGGRNVFADLPALAPRIDVEAVLAEDPQAIVASGMDEQRPEWLDDWKKWPSLQAVKNGHLFHVPPDVIQRHSLRIAQGAKILCQQLDQVRQ